MKGIPNQLGPFIVYMAKNMVNGKKYVGVTSKRKYVKRQQEHARDARTGRMSCKKFHFAINKYGYAIR